MLNQAAGDRDILAEKLHISAHQMECVTNSGQGEGLIKYGGTVLPFVDHFPPNTTMYRLMTTKPEEQQLITEIDNPLEHVRSKAKKQVLGMTKIEKQEFLSRMSTGKPNTITVVEVLVYHILKEEAEMPSSE